jgi:hypothetical protein
MKSKNLQRITILLAFSFSTLASARSLPTEPGLIGNWVFEFLGTTTDSLTFLDDSHLKQKSYLNGILYFDYEATYTLDTTANPKRFVLTATKVNPSQVVQMKVGSQMFCIYRLSGELLDANCSSDQYPESFAEGLSYTRVPDQAGQLELGKQ